MLPWPMLIYQLLFHSAHPHHSHRCEVIPQHSIFIEMRQGQRTRQKYIVSQHYCFIHDSSAMTSCANISVVIPQCSSSSFRSLRSHPTTLHRDAPGSKGKAKVRWRGWKVVKEEEGQLGPMLGKARLMVPVLVPPLSWASLSLRV